MGLSGVHFMFILENLVCTIGRYQLLRLYGI